MSFVSLEFLVFFVLVLTAYHALAGRVGLQNLILLFASAVFYGWWDWRFLGLLFLSVTVNYIAARAIERVPEFRKTILVSGIFANLGVLFVFKYFDFFVRSFDAISTLAGFQSHSYALELVLPIGISFYTFQSIAYLVDVYRRDLSAERDFVAFAVFITFFPQLVAGPIERAGHMLPQFHMPRQLTREIVEHSIWLIVWGYLLKVVVADGLAPFVDASFRSDQIYGWSTVLSTIAFAFQIFGDFAGYSFIAKGVAGLFGFSLISNFRQPYFAVSIQDFWRRWHVSLSQFLRDYLYVPLGGNRGGTTRTACNLMVVMILGGLWHGASWTFLLWGVFHGAGLATVHIWRRSPGRRLAIPAMFDWAMTMAFVLFGWFLFRVPSGAAIGAMAGSLDNWTWLPGHTELFQTLLLLGAPTMIVEALLYRSMMPSARVATAVQPLALAALTLVLIFFSGTTRSTFIYFQF